MKCAFAWFHRGPYRIVNWGRNSSVSVSTSLLSVFFHPNPSEFSRLTCYQPHILVYNRHPALDQWACGNRENQVNSKTFADDDSLPSFGSWLHTGKIYYPTHSDLIIMHADEVTELVAVTWYVLEPMLAESKQSGRDKIEGSLVGALGESFYV